MLGWGQEIKKKNLVFTFLTFAVAVMANRKS